MRNMGRKKGQANIEEYAKFLDEVLAAETPQEYRRIHEKWKERGFKVRFTLRYPMFVYYVSMICSVISIIISVWIILSRV